MQRELRKDRGLWWPNQTLIGGALLLALVLVLILPGTVAAGPVPRLEDLEVVQHARVTPDDKLDQLRGRYDTWLFGYEIVGELNATSGDFTGRVTFETNVPLEQVDIRPTSVSFNNGQVSYNAGIGNTSLGSGIFSVAQVVGENIIFISNMDVTLNIVGLTTPSVTSLSTKPTVSGITR